MGWNQAAWLDRCGWERVSFQRVRVVGWKGGKSWDCGLFLGSGWKWSVQTTARLGALGKEGQRLARICNPLDTDALHWPMRSEDGEHGAVSPTRTNPSPARIILSFLATGALERVAGKRRFVWKEPPSRLGRRWQTARQMGHGGSHPRFTRTVPFLPAFLFGTCMSWFGTNSFVLSQLQEVRKCITLQSKPHRPNAWVQAAQDNNPAFRPQVSVLQLTGQPRAPHVQAVWSTPLARFCPFLPAKFGANLCSPPVRPFPPPTRSLARAYATAVVAA